MDPSRLTQKSQEALHDAQTATNEPISSASTVLSRLIAHEGCDPVYRARPLRRVIRPEPVGATATAEG